MLYSFGGGVSLARGTCRGVNPAGSPDRRPCEENVSPIPPRNLRSLKNDAEITSEEIREKRRAERKQFKLDRARAIAAVAAEAEAIFESEGRVITPALSGPNIPSAATWKPTPATTDEPLPSLPLPLPQDVDEEELEDLEHLQLTLPEAFFLIWNFDCLTVLNPDTVSYYVSYPLFSMQISFYPARTHESRANMEHVPTGALVPSNTQCPSATASVRQSFSD